MLQRPRRNRRTGAIRDLVQETHLSPSHLVYPLFVIEGTDVKDEILSLPGNYRLSLDNILEEIEDCMRLGLQSFILFPVVPESYKDKIATYSYQPENFYLIACAAFR